MNDYKYVSLTMWCAEHHKEECFAFPALLAEDEIKTRCENRIEQFIHKHMREKSLFNLNYGGKFEYISSALWKDRDGQFW